MKQNSPAGWRSQARSRGWGFEGVIVSDWYATRSVAGASEDLLDLAMPGPVSPWTKGLLEAVRSGQISASAVDGHVLRTLRLASRLARLTGLAPAVAAAGAGAIII
jgi:beta-glucosidase